MAEIKIPDEPPLQPKRKPDAEPLEFPAKSLKLESAEDSQSARLDAAEERALEAEDGAENSNGSALVDRKGKGIPREDKGKGKMEVEDEDDDDCDDSSDDDSVGGSELENGDESDLSDDPLAEVDLDNILPSRTRRRRVQPGVYIADDLANDDDDSDDSDA